MIDDALLPAFFCIAASVIYALNFVSPGSRSKIRWISSMHGVLFVTGTLYALAVERFTIELSRDELLYYLVPFYCLNIAGIFSVGASVVLHTGRKILHISQLFNIGAASWLFLVGITSITHDGL